VSVVVSSAERVIRAPRAILTAAGLDDNADLEPSAGWRELVTAER
jgi:hypothetical protein